MKCLLMMAGVLGLPTITDYAERPAPGHYGGLLEISVKVYPKTLFSYLSGLGQADDKSSDDSGAHSIAGSEELVNLGLFADRCGAYRMLATEGIYTLLILVLFFFLINNVRL